MRDLCLGIEKARFSYNCLYALQAGRIVLQATEIRVLGFTSILHKDIFWNVYKACVAPFRKDSYKMILVIVPVLAMLTTGLAPAHPGETESFTENAGLLLPAFGTVIGPPTKAECTAPTGLPNITYTESHIMITAVATIWHGGDYMLGSLKSIAVYEAGGHTYAIASTSSFYDGIQIVDITDPASPEAVTAVRDDERSRVTVLNAAIHEAGGRTYAITSNDRDTIRIMDITDPASPEEVKSIPYNSRYKNNDADDIVIHEAGGRTYALVTASSIHGIQFIDITDPASSSVITTVLDGRLSEYNTWDIAIHETGGTTYALTAFSNGAIRIIDITDPASSLEVVTVWDGGDFELDGPRDIAIHKTDGRTYALVAVFNGDAIQVIDITDPASPSAVATVRDGGYFELDGPIYIAIHETGGRTYALVAVFNGDAIQVIDITDPASPSAVATVRDGGGNFELDGPRNITIHETGGITYILIPSSHCRAIQIMQIEAGTSVTAHLDTGSGLTALVLETASIPSWVKNNAGWWADGTIDDASFVTAIGYLIGNGIIQIPPASQDAGNEGGTANTVIPSWIKTNAGWWADGTIDDALFVIGIQYMITNGIIVLS